MRITLTAVSAALPALPLHPSHTPMKTSWQETGTLREAWGVVVKLSTKQAETPTISDQLTSDRFHWVSVQEVALDYHTKDI